MSEEGRTWELILASTLYLKTWLKTRLYKVQEKTTRYVHEVNHKCSIGVFRTCDLEKNHAAQARTPEEAIQQVLHPRESVWDPKSLLVLYLIQQCSWGWWFTVEATTNFCNAHHMTEEDMEGHGEGKLGGGDKALLHRPWNPENSWCRSECRVWNSVCSKPTEEVIKCKHTTVQCVPRVFEDIHFETFIEDVTSQLWSKKCTVIFSSSESSELKLYSHINTFWNIYVGWILLISFFKTVTTVLMLGHISRFEILMWKGNSLNSAVRSRICLWKRGHFN